MTPLCTLSTWFPSQRYYGSVSTLPHKASPLKYLLANESLHFRMCCFVIRVLEPILSDVTSALCMLSLRFLLNGSDSDNDNECTWSQQALGFTSRHVHGSSWSDIWDRETSPRCNPNPNPNETQCPHNKTRQLSHSTSQVMGSSLSYCGNNETTAIILQGVLKYCWRGTNLVAIESRCLYPRGRDYSDGRRRIFNRGNGREYRRRCMAAEYSTEMKAKDVERLNAIWEFWWTEI
jgi:hypothetical protein